MKASSSFSEQILDSNWNVTIMNQQPERHYVQLGIESWKQKSSARQYSNIQLTINP